MPRSYRLSPPAVVNPAQERHSRHHSRAEADGPCGQTAGARARAWSLLLGGALAFASLAGAQSASSLTGLKKLSLEELMDVEVTSVSRRPQRLSETASAIQVVTGEDIRRSGATRIPEALRLATNLAVAQIDSRQWAISARGFNSTTSNKLLVMMDGRTVYTPLYAGVFWDVQDTLLADVDRIEVISGPGATLWGANAVNGVINITTKHARETHGLLLEAAGGTELAEAGGVRYGGELTPNVHYRVYGKHFNREATLLANGASARNDWHMEQGGLRVDWDVSPGDLVTFQGDLYDGEAGQLARDDIDMRGGNVLGRWTRTLDESSSVQLQVYFDRTNRTIPGALSQNLSTHDLDFQHAFVAAERHHVVWGANYRFVDDSIGASQTLTFLPADVQQQRISAFVQDDIAFVEDQLHLTVGTKIEHNDYTGLEYQPSLRFAWRPRKDQTAWAAISRAVRTPSRVDRDLYSPATPPYTVLAGGPGFRSERLIAYEAGYRAQPLPRLALAVAGYYNVYDDLRSIERPAGPTSTPITIGNGLEGTSYGTEVTGDYRVTDRWRLRAGYSRLIIDLQPQPGSSDASGGSNESHDADHLFSLNSSVDITPRLELDATFRHSSGIANQQVPAYDELELRLAWRPTESLELSAVGQNLLDAAHPEFGAAATRQEIERSVYGKVTWRY